ncbi:uncharacterized protein LOC123023520 [Varanus komodoensis]|uniref:uncharacterized protein LOC123023520 n=1 Tax=Varanus komodoensis TaxID=61221 RepID=UPI001CF7A1BB|nr:uncharacterized protein LOC123023520 [Varanus komodoensis]
MRTRGCWAAARLRSSSCFGKARPLALRGEPAGGWPGDHPPAVGTLHPPPSRLACPGSSSPRPAPPAPYSALDFAEGAHAQSVAQHVVADLHPPVVLLRRLLSHLRPALRYRCRCCRRRRRRPGRTTMQQGREGRREGDGRQRQSRMAGGEKGSCPSISSSGSRVPAYFLPAHLLKAIIIRQKIVLERLDCFSTEQKSGFDKLSTSIDQALDKQLTPEQNMQNIQQAEGKSETGKKISATVLRAMMEKDKTAWPQLKTQTLQSKLPWDLRVILEKDNLADHLKDIMFMWLQLKTPLQTLRWFNGKKTERSGRGVKKK